MNIHKCIHGVGFKEHVTQASKETQKPAMEMGTPDMHTDQSNKGIWAKGVRNVPLPYPCPVQLSRKRNEDSPNYMLVTMYLSPL